jgi:hypothetical protein
MKSAEIKAQNLKSEEEKLTQMKSNLLREKSILEQQREQVSLPSPLLTRHPSLIYSTLVGL